MTDEELGLNFGDALTLAMAMNEKRRLRAAHDDAARRGHPQTMGMFPKPTDGEIQAMAARLGKIVRELGLD